MLIKENAAFIRSYLEDASSLKGGYADKVVIPESVEEISSVLKEANSEAIPVTISGGGTGQAGGRIPFGGIVLSLEKLNGIKELKKLDKGGSAILEAGVLIKDIKASCDHKRLFYTYDPTEQTASIGGTVATNAAGARSFRYGPTRKYVRALKILLADGSIILLKRGDIKAKGRLLEFELNKKHYKVGLPAYKMPRTKNSAGFYAEDNMDLVDLFIGQEGTLGVVLEAELELLDKPRDFFGCFAFLRNERSAWDFVADARKAWPLSIEYFDSNCLKLLQGEYGNVPDFAEAAIFLEDEILDSEDTMLEKWERVLSKYDISLDNTWAAMNESAHRRFLEKRHFVPEKMAEMARHSGFPKISTDLAVPLEKSKEMLGYYSDALSGAGLRYFIFGHIGDAHLHVNMLPTDEGSFDKAKQLQLKFVQKSVSLGGTVSAEHGIGKTKKKFLKLLYGENGVEEMIRVKKAFDPRLILGRGNIFDLL